MKDPINKNIKLNLFSPNTETVLSALNAIKEHGNKHYIPLLFDLLISGPEKEIEEEISKLLGSIKDKDTVNTFMRALEVKKYTKIRKIILTACWQNGLDFSTFLPVFIDLIVDEEWETAFEAFTIVDNFEYIPPENIVRSALEKIDDSLEKVNEQKKYFLQEIRAKLVDPLE